ncbi:abscisic acid 8'-hydroxylase 2 [Dioscorea cayenensis subsp. rotundata]|uniref:Abscisic acid 8'-hydroxylase 2 n=1 Tax=Dioscorea cayennensis subsp. rotundata TaxID=55577 RepID=A0AB40BCB7_DIOCR|nr:abscisic acid 8'-hydroxylase 2 [Dioscorea cayenensis subsp. rotundata]
MDLSFSYCFFLFLHLLSVLLIVFMAIEFLKILVSRSTEMVNPPPGSLGPPFIGETPAFISANSNSKGLYEFVKTRHLKYGSCFKTSIFGSTHVFISSTEAAKLMLSGESLDFSKRYIRSIAELLGDQSLLCASKETHKLVRHRISNLFTSDSFSSSINFFDELTLKTMAQWEQRKSALVLDDAMKITFNAICKMLISLSEENELQILQKDVLQVNEAMLAIPLNLPGTRFYKGLKARKRIMNTLKRIIELRRKGLEFHDDFLQSLLRRDDDDNDYEPLADKQILDNILTLIIAGQDTTANAIAWMVKYLDENQEVQDTLRLNLSSENHGHSLGVEALNRMSYASKVVKESLRMMTIVSWFPRVAMKECQIDGFQIKKGWILNVDARAIHYDPKVYEDPTKFNPSRFEEDAKPYSFLAFGVGGRSCLGMNLAKAMMLVFLYRLMTKFRWRVTDKDSSLEKWGIFPRLRTGCPVHVTPINTECESL